MPPDDTRSSILTAADQLFGEFGFDATTTRDIAARSGINKALIHYHFGSKDELLTALLDDYYQRLTTTLLGALGRHGQPHEQAAELVDAYADFLAANRTFFSLVQRELLGGHHVAQLVTRTLPAFQMGTAWLAQLAAEPPPGMEPVHVLTSVYGVVVSHFTYGRVLAQLTGQDPFAPAALESRKRHVRRVVSLLFAELTTAPAARPGGTAWPRSTPRTSRKKTAS